MHFSFRSRFRFGKFGKFYSRKPFHDPRGSLELAANFAPGMRCRVNVDVGVSNLDDAHEILKRFALKRTHEICSSDGSLREQAGEFSLPHDRGRIRGIKPHGDWAFLPCVADVDVSHGGVFNVHHGKRIVQTLAVPAQHKGGFGRSVDWGRLLLAREGSLKFSALSSGRRNRQKQQTNQKYEHAGQPDCFKTITHRRLSFYDKYLARQTQRISKGLEYRPLMLHSQNAIPVENG